MKLLETTKFVYIEVRKKNLASYVIKWKKKSKAAKSNIDSRMTFMMNKATTVYTCQCVHVLLVVQGTLKSLLISWLYTLLRKHLLKQF